MDDPFQSLIILGAAVGLAMAVGYGLGWRGAKIEDKASWYWSTAFEGVIPGVMFGAVAGLAAAFAYVGLF